MMSFGFALLAGASVVYWVLGLMSLTHPYAPVATAMAAPDDSSTRDLARALGANLQAPASTPAMPSTQYQLLGVVAGTVGKGYALLAVGSAAPKAYTVGSALGDGLVLQSVSARGAKIGPSIQAPPTLELALPKPHGW
jgi:general secretion pathway protein C